MNTWLALIISLPTENATVRMRAWRGLKACGAAVLRDGVYLLPERDACRAELLNLAEDVLTGGGAAHLLRVEALNEADYVPLFDRSADYAKLLADLAELRERLNAEQALDVLKQLRKQRKAFAALCEIDFFPGEAQKQAAGALQALELAAARAMSPDEPQPMAAEISLLDLADYQGRRWATRARLWVDRLACAWLIRRFIDPQAHLLWLASPAECPPDALGFDFDGARFSHIGARVSFEVLLASFGLEQGPLLRLAALVHYLDVGGVQPAEAVGVESVLAGLREALLDDDALLLAACGVFDGLYAHFVKQGSAV